MNRAFTYVLITPARNEEEFIELTLKSVINQTRRPLKWVIVSDGSTDGTNAIVEKYTRQHDWITLVKREPRSERSFCAKVKAFNVGYEELSQLSFDAIGNLDADISFGPDHFEFLIGELAKNPRLGVVGSTYQEGGRVTYDYRFASTDDVPGACQVFRRECFESIGGYKLLKTGVDLAAVLSARIHGWQTHCFTEKSCVHARPSGSAMRNGVRRFVHAGVRDYELGCHPLWEIGRCLRRVATKPYFVVSTCMMVGYFMGLALGYERTMPAELVAFRRKEQLSRLRRICGFGAPMLSSAK